MNKKDETRKDEYQSLVDKINEPKRQKQNQIEQKNVMIV